MNIFEMDIMNTLLKNPFLNQRVLAEQCGYSIGVVNRSLRSLMEQGLLNEKMELTESATQMIESKKPHNAIILAAGYGMRMVPINLETPKGLLKVKGELLIERLIRQLQETGIYDITIVTGFMKESYEYLIDEFGVKLLVNPEYSVKNNLHSLKMAAKYIGNTYLIPCDIWCSENPFRSYEFYSWYMVNELTDQESTVRVNRKMELVTDLSDNGGNKMVGIAYLDEVDGKRLGERIQQLSKDRKYDGAFWEEALYAKGRMYIHARVVSSDMAVEINTYEQLRDLDSNSTQLKSDAIDTAAQVLSVEPEDITGITVLKKGMTNRSFLFHCRQKKYIMRIPGEGTDFLINRVQEAEVYHAIAGKGFCDDLIYINPDNGYKITEYIDGTHVCDPDNVEELRKCMEVLRSFHERKLTVDHSFDVFAQIDFYEKLWNGNPSCFRDYEKVKKNILSLRDYIEKHAEPFCLTHVDANPDNFLISTDENGNEKIQLIDWEYAGMQDPHIDLAMFCIYTGYDRKKVDRLIDIYFEGCCSAQIRTKIYCYIAVCGLLWSNWCEYKRTLGVEFGEYSLRQYRYAKEYFTMVQEIVKEEGNDKCIQ